jgi:hypothetical protein
LGNDALEAMGLNSFILDIVRMYLEVCDGTKVCEMAY